MPEPGLYPRGGPRPTSSAAERATYDALARGLPAGWYAWHSLRVRTPAQDDGECDFVVAVPGRGVLLLEVKGGRLWVEDGRWLQNGHPLAEAPLDQVYGFQRKLIAVLRRQGALQIPWVAVACVFPETSFDDGPPQPHLQGCVLGALDMGYLRDALPALAKRVFDRKLAPASDAWIDALHALWGERWVPKLSLGGSARQREAEFVALDAQQLGTLDLLADNPRVLVEGAAGTGKTILATELFRRWSGDGGAPPLLLCWTRPLCLELRTAGIADAWTIRELGAELLTRADRTPQGGAPSSEWTPETWERVTPEATALLAAHPGAPRRVIVDEAQDFSADDWALLVALAGDEAIWAFGDPGQSFWSDARQPPAGLFPAKGRLTARYRCPASLVAFADRYRAGVAVPADAPPPGDALRVVVVERMPLARAEPARTDISVDVRAAAPESPTDAVDDAADAPATPENPPDPAQTAHRRLEACVAAELDRLRRGGVAPADIAVLSLAGRSKSRIGSGARIGGHEVVRADDEAAPAQLVADTGLRFKGLERPWIIVTELGLGPSRYDVRMHIALTRATVGCVVVATEAELDADPRLRGA